MAPMNIQGTLKRCGRMLTRWRVEIRLMFYMAIVFTCLWIFSFSDIFIQFGRLGRVSAWLILIALIITALYFISRIMAQRHTIQGVATVIEKAFPQLDNHLINYIQFSSDNTKNPFKAAYVRHGIPKWQEVNIKRMKNRKAHIIACLALFSTIALLVLPIAVKKQTWTVALWRIINPFSNCSPISLTNIIDVKPGNATVLQGNPLILLCDVKGKKGHLVRLDIKPSDGNKATYNIGNITSDGVKTFSYPIAKATTGLKYRFRAGDSPSPKWYTINVRQPLALTKMDLIVTPPEYTTILPRKFDGIGEEVQILQGSEVEVTVSYNSPLISARILTMDQDSVTLKKTDNDFEWKGLIKINDGSVFTLIASNSYKEIAESVVNFKLLPDKAPVIKILSPKGRTILAKGSKPNIEFTVVDDYGLSEIIIEQIPPGSIKKSQGKTINNWMVKEGRHFEERWESDTGLTKGGTVAFKVVAKDKCGLGMRVSKSPSIIFSTIENDQAVEKKRIASTEASANMGKLIELQRDNFHETKNFLDVIKSIEAERWSKAADKQKTIRKLARQLLNNPLKPLGSMTPAIQDLYMEEMQGVIAEFNRTAELKDAQKNVSAKKGILLEETILRKLTEASMASKKTVRQRKIAGIMSMLEALVKEESNVIDSTKNYIIKKLSIGDVLIDKQDELVDDLNDFIKACRREAPVLAKSDENFSKLVLSIADNCKDKQIKRDMLKAGEELDDNAPEEAVPHEKDALVKLEALQKMMNKWQMTAAKETLAEAIESLGDAKERIKKLAKIQSKIVDAVKQIEAQKDKSGEDTDLMEEEEEEVEELKKNMKEALLEIPTDLHIFQELSVANELMEDVYSVFEEVRATDTSDLTVADVGENPWLKEEALLEGMKKAEGRMDSFEMWLGEKEETDKETAEASDKEELTFMALGALATAAEDLVGDLLEEHKDIQEKADDSATNRAVPDVDPGWNVAEGGTASFGAQGKSGNTSPDHKEQDGRSNIGRQGMATGEAAAGSGTIGEGDKNIEKRMTTEPTQSGQVQADGDADAVATGGGKQGSGAAEEMGMSGAGGGKRMDSTLQGTQAGLENLMSKTQAMYVKASLLNLRTESLGAAAHYIRQANDAVAAGLPSRQIREYQKRAIASLKRARTELSAGASDYVEDENQTVAIDNLVEEGTEQAPRAYRKLVSEYFKSLNESI